MSPNGKLALTIGGTAVGTLSLEHLIMWGWRKIRKPKVAVVAPAPATTQQAANG